MRPRRMACVALLWGCVWFAVLLPLIKAREYDVGDALYYYDDEVYDDDDGGDYPAQPLKPEDDSDEYYDGDEDEEQQQVAGDQRQQGKEGSSSVEDYGGNVEYDPPYTGEQAEAAIRVESRYNQAVRALFLDWKTDRLTKAVAELESLFEELDAALPYAPRLRARYWPPPPSALSGAAPTRQQQQHPQTPAAAETDGAAEGASGTGAAAGLPQMPMPADAPGAEPQAAAAADVGAFSTLVPSGGPSVPPFPGQLPYRDAAFALATLLSVGLAGGGAGLAANDSRAVYVLHRAALAGSREAQMALADRYAAGRGVRQDVEEGMRRAVLVADALVHEAEEGMSYGIPGEPVWLRDRFRGGYYPSPHEAEWNTQEDVDYDLEAAMRGDPEAQRRMGYRRLVGEGVERDHAGAQRDFQAAAEAGDPGAMFHLAVMHLRGLHVEKNLTKARELMDSAARHGVEAAYNGLGNLEAEGGGSGRGKGGKAIPDYAAARLYYESGAELDDPDCTFNLGTLYATGRGVSRNYTTAAAYFEAALKLGQWRAPYALAVLHHQGLGVGDGGEGGGGGRNSSYAQTLMRLFFQERSHWAEQLEAAVEALDEGSEMSALLRYALLAEQGCVPAIANLGWLLSRPDPAPQVAAWGGRYSAALKLQLHAARLGDPTGWADAGSLVYQGEEYLLPGGRNLTRALEYYEAGAGAGDVEAMCSLGWMHFRGQGVPRNASASVSWYRRALTEAPSLAHSLPPAAALAFVAAVDWLLRVRHWMLDSSGGGGGGGGGGGDAAARRVGGGGNGVDFDWEALVLTALALLLTLVLWRRQRVRQQSLAAQRTERGGRAAQEQGQQRVAGSGRQQGEGGLPAAAVRQRAPSPQRQEEAEGRRGPSEDGVEADAPLPAAIQ